MASDSPVSRGTPTEEELRWIVNRIQVATKREGEVWRWLSEHVSGLLEDRARMDWLDEAVPSGAFRTACINLPSIWPGSVRSLADAARRALDSTRVVDYVRASLPPESGT